MRCSSGYNQIVKNLITGLTFYYHQPEQLFTTLAPMNAYLQIHPDDNVLVALQDIHGEEPISHLTDITFNCNKIFLLNINSW